MKLTVLDEVTSTNEVVKNALREGKAEGLIVRARRQLSGYGRRRRMGQSRGRPVHVHPAAPRRGR